LADGTVSFLGGVCGSAKLRHLEAQHVSEPAGAPIRIGISSCLLGQKLRYDSGHKHNIYLVETFGRFVE
jgi:hypothetical protein